MPQFSTDFTEYSDGTDLYTQDWSAPIGNTLNTWEKQSSGGEAYGVFQQNTSQRTPVTWDDLDSPNTTDLEWLLLVEPQNFDSSNNNEIYTMSRGSGQSSSDLTLYRTGFRSTSSFSAEMFPLHGKYVNGSFTALGSGNDVAGTQIYMRSQVQGNTLRTRGWDSDNNEPTTWEVEDTDSDITSDGYAGLFTFRDNVDMHVHFVGVGTEGDRAPGFRSKTVNGQVVRVDARTTIAGTDRGELVWSDFNPQSQTNIDLSDSETARLQDGAGSGSFTTQTKSQ